MNRSHQIIEALRGNPVQGRIDLEVSNAKDLALQILRQYSRDGIQSFFTDKDIWDGKLPIGKLLSIKYLLKEYVPGIKNLKVTEDGDGSVTFSFRVHNKKFFGYYDDWNYQPNSEDIVIKEH